MKDGMVKRSKMRSTSTILKKVLHGKKGKDSRMDIMRKTLELAMMKNRKNPCSSKKNRIPRMENTSLRKRWL